MINPQNEAFQTKKTVVPCVFRCNGDDGIRVEVIEAFKPSTADGPNHGVRILMGKEDQNSVLAVREGSARVLADFFGQVADILFDAELEDPGCEL